MSALLALAWLVVFQAPQGAPPAPVVPPPDHPGFFALTDRGVIELTAFGERQQVDFGIEQFYFSPSMLEAIPTVASVRAFYLNVADWAPKDLYLIVGRKKLSTPRDEYTRLNGRAYSRGPVAFEVVTENLEPAALERAYKKLAGSKKRKPEEAEAFVVLEVRSAAGLAPRAYPLRIERPPAPGK